ncbi:hypothetical protein DKM44_10255 [Deinococcus irradiatisoli]|uniref:Uncharacterized protein n=1 Tax=Deinococcus irradiatisoli TaxID=2202254 RepID=A0A2Z3JJR2_9DEIO|nr:hypothetical protein [Deinococcus irradiatisoli]AWN23560.1 hypothetical protein DKM44_10255 [Deinococcus irradiatisoli]
MPHTPQENTVQEFRRYILEIQRPVGQGLLVSVQQEGAPGASPLRFSDEQTLLQFVSRLVRGSSGLR